MDDKPDNVQDPARKRVDFVLRYYAGEPGREWLASVWGRGMGHGSEIVHAVPGPDNVAKADDILKALEAAEWLVREKLRPTVSQRFFDVNGQMRAGQQPSGFNWSPNRDSEAFLAWYCHHEGIPVPERRRRGSIEEVSL